jgi:hypothetical protein
MTPKANLRVFYANVNSEVFTQPFKVKMAAMAKSATKDRKLPLCFRQFLLDFPARLGYIKMKAKFVLYGHIRAFAHEHTKNAKAFLAYFACSVGHAM